MGGVAMKLVWLTALVVGGATVLGGGLGFAFRRISPELRGMTLALAAGVMLAAAVLGLILPSLEYGGRRGWLITVAGILTGAVCMALLGRLVPRLHSLAGLDARSDPELDRVLLFVLAMVIHKLPEGIAAGVGFGTDDTREALLIAGGIALQNIPEGMVIVAPMLSAGIRPGRVAAWIAVTALVEAAGTVAGFLAVSEASATLPFALAFAGGTMLYVLSGDMLTQGQDRERWGYLAGFCLMLALDSVLAG